MVKTDCLIASLRQAAGSTPCGSIPDCAGSKIAWWIEQADRGTHFCFEDAEGKRSFASMCQNFGIPCLDA